MASLNYTDERVEMVRTQLVGRSVSDKRVLDAMSRVPRHLFVPEELEHLAYDDGPLQIGEGQTISQPYIVAFMTELLELGPHDRVLEVGTGSGYQAAILSLLAGEVITVERVERLANRAHRRLGHLGYHDVDVVHADGTVGLPEKAPFDAIIVTAGGPKVPPSLVDQLAVGGRLVCPVGSRRTQRMVKLVRTADGSEQEDSIQCVFVPLIGAEGWAD